MIDVHAHILPGRDDGPANIKDSLEMARIAVEDGITTMVATPHSLDGLYENSRTEILGACRHFTRALDEAGIPLHVLPGSEISLCPEILSEFRKNRVMTINDKGGHVFLELAERIIPAAARRAVVELKTAGICPIISHPERNPDIQNDSRILAGLVSAGALSQITGGSLIGDFGRASFRCSRHLLEQGLVHFMASDAHAPSRRPPVLSKAFERLCSLVGEETARRIVHENPRAVLGVRDDEGPKAS